MSGSQVQCPACSNALVVPSMQPVPMTANLRKSGGPVLASWVMIGVTCLVALIPGIGFLTWIIAAPILFITLVLGIVALNKGATTQGILILISSIIVAPAFLILAPIVTTVIATGAAASAASTTKPTITESTLDTGSIPDVQETTALPEPSSPVIPDSPAPALEESRIRKPEGNSMGETVSFRDSSWVVIAAKEMGNTLPAKFFTEEERSEGRYIYVRYKVTNKTNEEEMIAFAPVVRDSRGRKFEAISGIHLPDNEKTIGLEPLPAGIPKTFSAIFEVAEDSEGLSFLARNFEPFGTQYKPIILNFTNLNEEVINQTPKLDITAAVEGESPKIDREMILAKERQEIENKRSKIADLKGELAKVDSRIETDRTRWQNALDTINRLTNYKKTPVQEGSYAYKQCVAASEVIQDVEAGATHLKAEKARLEATIKELESPAVAP
jgi:hypothetical protein